MCIGALQTFNLFQLPKQSKNTEKPIKKQMQNNKKEKEKRFFRKMNNPV